MQKRPVDKLPFIIVGGLLSVMVAVAYYVDWQDQKEQEAAHREAEKKERLEQAAQQQRIEDERVQFLNSCAGNWQKCTDTADLSSHYKEYYKIKAACEIAAKGIAQYGDPQFPGVLEGGSFGYFKNDPNLAQSGIATLTEPHAQYSNGFGAMVHVGVVCDYDLNQKKVTRIKLAN